MSLERVEGLRLALEATPDNHAVRLMLAEMLVAEGAAEEALAEFDRLQAARSLSGENMLVAGRAALDAGRQDRAQEFAEAASEVGVVEGVSELRSEINVSLGLQHAVHILPFQRHDLYEKYNRRAGGGVLLFGPPGCGKTMLARATAGECALPFSNVRIEEILDPLFGVSEGNLHDAFVQARRFAPCVLFLDELDAIAFARRKHVGSAGRPLVDQLLQELDSIGSDKLRASESSRCSSMDARTKMSMWQRSRSARLSSAAPICERSSNARSTWSSTRRWRVVKNGP